MALLSLTATKATGVAKLEKDPRKRPYVVPGATSPPLLRPVAESIFVMPVATFPEATDSVKLRLQLVSVNSQSTCQMSLYLFFSLGSYNFFPRVTLAR